MSLLVAAVGCGGAPSSAAHSTQPVTLRVGVGQITPGNPLNGLRQVASNLSFEGLIRIGPDGRARPWLAKSWSLAADGLSINLELRPEAKFHDGSRANATIIAAALQGALPQFLGPVFDDIKGIEPSADGHRITITFKRPSPLLPESLEANIRKPGAPTIGTGPFVSAKPDSTGEILANADYYLGPPAINRIVVTSYPTIRAAWAEMLRNNIDMLYEVGSDAVSSMQQATSVSMYSFTRPYQYVVLLNVRAPKFKSAAVRRALNAAIDRAQVVRDGFDGHAIAASGLVWPQNWAFANGVGTTSFNPQAAATVLKSKPALRFTCLVPTDYERIALVVQRQLAMVGVTMDVEAVTPARAYQTLAAPSFEAVMTDIVAGASLLRPYELWHSGGSLYPGGIGSPEMDSALDRIRGAGSDEEYRKAVGNFQKVTTDDPPAIYLAWGERSRAVSKRFDVPVEAGRDVLGTIRLWKPLVDQRAARN
ncbi:MAG TPA: ABC transporter substrate-binding protein [Vicinamibacterales bacterium]|nr:ABC transporter substrate-binding protein [Vicinamibacterales bacterium]